MFYIVRFSYVPNTAACNRMLSMIQALSDLRVETKVIFMMPDNLFSKVSKEYPCVTFEYYWEKLYINNKYFKYISYYLYVQRLIRRLNINDNVLVLGGCGILSQIVRKKGINVYHEMTEHPLCVDLGDRLFKISLNKYVNTLKKINGLFVISNALKDYFVSQGICEQKIQVVNMTVDASRFDDIKKTELKERYIAYCGNGSNHKDGVDVLIKAFAIVAQTHEDVKLYLIGSDTSKDAIENKMLVKE